MIKFPLCSSTAQPIYTKRQSYCLQWKSKTPASWYERNKEYQKANARRHTTEYRDAFREYLWQNLLIHSYAACGETDPAVLEFHHNYGKDMAISEMIMRITKVETLEEELHKCTVLCPNCHRRLTAKVRGWFRSKK